MRKVWLPGLKRTLAVLVVAALAALALRILGILQADHPAQSIGLCLVAISILVYFYARSLLSNYKLNLDTGLEWRRPGATESTTNKRSSDNFDPNKAIDAPLSPTGAHRAIATGAPVRASLNFPEDGLRQFFLILPEYCFLVSHDGEMIDSNPAACEALGYKREELLGRPFSNLAAPESAGTMQEAFHRWKAEGELRSQEVTILTKQSERRTVLLNIGSIRSFDGRVLLAMSVVVDITERKRQEQAVKESEERFRLAINTAPMMVWVSGCDKLCTYFNKAWLDFTGRPIEAELGNGWADGVHPEDLQQCVETYEWSFDERKDFRMEYRLLRHDGEYRWIIDIGVPRFSPDGVFAGYIGSCVDVTDRKRAEDDRITMLESIAQLNRAASMGQLAASLAHELAQPLTAILSNAQAAARFANMPEPNLEEIREALKEITEDDQRARAFLFNMRAMFQRQKISRVLVDLNNVILDASRMVRNDAARKGVQIRVNPCSQPVLALGDPTVVQQIILNLVNNAMDAQEHVPLGQKLVTLTSACVQHERMGTILVEDNGSGIREENKSRLFKPFFTTKPNGLGLGLSICRSLIESLDGRIWLVDRPEPGAAFKVELPAVDQQTAKHVSEAPIER
jgi:PAS domain S-box-containing protein